MKTLCIVLLVLLGHQALAFRRKKQQNSIHKSVPVENLKNIPNPGVTTGDSRTTPEIPRITIEDTGVPMFKLNHLRKPMAHQDLTKQKRKQHHQSILNSVPVNKIKDQLKISGQMISGKMRGRQSQNDVCDNLYGVFSCTYWADFGYCTTGDYTKFMAEYCKEACCYKECGDDDDCDNEYSSCPVWAELGFCTTGDYTKFMANNCQKACCTGCFSPNTCQCGKINTQRIYGGKEVDPKQKYPWQVGLKKGHSLFHCGGSIINDRWILTAAHCIVKHDKIPVNHGKNPVTYEDQCILTEIDYEVIVGEHNQHDDDDDAKTYGVKKHIPHSNYDCKHHDYDFALLELKEQILFGNSIRPICLPENKDEAYVGRTATVTGWGLTNLTSPNELSENLREVQVQIISNTACGHRNHTIPWEKLCAGAGELGKGHGGGDSGGPLVVVEDNKYVQVGIVSNSRSGKYKIDIYARVSAVLPWISSTTANGNKCG